jgi:hypothetical protein
VNALCLRDALSTLQHQGKLRMSQRQAITILVRHHVIRKTRHGYQAVAPAAMGDTLYTKSNLVMVTTETGQRIARYSTTVYIYTSALDWLAGFIATREAAA